MDALEKQYTARRLSARQDDLLALAREALRASDADQTQVRISALDTALTRFAASEMHQSTFERQASATITARVESAGGLQEGVVTTNKLDKENLASAAHQAAAAARLSPPNNELADLAQGPFDYPFQVDYFESTAATSAADRAKLVARGFEASEDKDFTAAGTLSTGQVNLVIANSRGVEAALNTTSARYTVLYSGPDSSGYAEKTSRNIGDIDTEGLAVRALATAKKTAGPRGDVPAGRYTVVLGPECIATMLGFLSWLGFSGRSYLDGASFMYGRIGEPVCGGNVTLMDDALVSRTLGLPCDFAGLPKQRLLLVEDGIARAVAHNVDTAARAGGESTGHDIGGRDPLPTNMVLMGGTQSREELIAGVERGIYVSRFHYTNVIDPLNTVITGMTRDGTYIIENGELAHGITNFRFTQNILAALSHVTGLGTDMVYMGGQWGSGFLVPEAIRIDDFNFSGKTSF
jgi:predicted Zn-dependent protease